MLPPAKERGGKVNAPLDPAPLSLKACYLGPLFHKHLVFLLEDCGFIHILKKSLKHNNHYWAKINMSHQPDDDVKETRFASSGVVLDRI